MTPKRPPSAIKKKGRKRQFNKAVKETIINLTKQGYTQGEVAKLTGYHPSTISIWKSEYPDLGKSLDETVQKLNPIVEKSAFEQATGTARKNKDFYPPNFLATRFWLMNKARKDWTESAEGEVTQQITFMGKDGSGTFER